MSEIFPLEGTCGKNVRAKAFKGGHSFKCEKRTGLRYWPPNDKRYGRETVEESDLRVELQDHCRTCELNKE